MNDLVTKTIPQLGAAADLHETDRLVMARGEGPATSFTLELLQAYLSGKGFGPAIVRPTRAELDAVTPSLLFSLGQVLGDPAGNVPNGNGVYSWTGSAWSWIGPSVDPAIQAKFDALQSEASRPSWAGKVNGWPDPFFRRFDLKSQLFLGRDRWYQQSGTAFAGWTRVANSKFPGGCALRREAGYNQITQSGPLIHLDEMGAAPGDTVTAYLLIMDLAAGGGRVYGKYRFSSAGDTVVNGAEGLMSNATGNTNGIVADATPKWLGISITVPTGAESLRLYPSNFSGLTGFDVLACWAFKGAATDGPAWPSLDDNYFALRDAEVVDRLDNLDFLTAPYVAWSSPRGDAEMVGDAVYAAKILGGRTIVSAKTIFDTIRTRVWASNNTTAIEWKVWIRDTTTSFNMSTTPSAASGTIPAGGFPTANALYELAIGSALVAEAGQDVVYAFRPVDGTNITQPSWIYDAAVNPARRGLILKLVSDWNNTFDTGNPTLSYGQIAPKLIYSAGRDSSLAPRVEAVEETVAALGAAVQIVVPPTIYAVQGREANVYFDNLHLAADAREFEHDVDCSAVQTGLQQNERWSLTPTGAVAAGGLTINVHDKRTGARLATASAALRAAAAAAGSGLNKKVLIIGDSLIDAGVITQTLVDVAGADAMGLTLLGTRGSGANKHEGRGGWTVSSYTGAGPTYYAFTVSGVTTPPLIAATEYSHNGAVYRVQRVDLTGGAGTIVCSVVSGGAPQASGTLTKSNGVAGDASIAFSASAAQPGNPFWISGVLNFAGYLSANSIAAPDWVLIQLGTNDAFGFTGTDAAVSAATDARLAQLDGLIASIKAAGAGIKVGLVMPPPPSFEQDSFGANYLTGVPRWAFKRNILIWSRQMIARYAGQEGLRVYLIPSNLALDTVNNMSRSAAAAINSRSAITAARQSNGVHPAISGYQQIGDALWAFLKVWAGV